MKNNKALAFLFVVFIILFSYWTYQQVRFYISEKEKRAFGNLPDISSTKTENIQDQEEKNQNNKTHDNSNQEIQNKNNQSAKAQKWAPNDYKKGDIKEKTYSVKYGDTLWEIAEGAYGDGSLWINILKANSQNIGFLPNGQQALIFPGQVLQIP